MAMSAMMEKQFMNVWGTDVLGGLQITDDGLILIAVDKRWDNHERIAAVILAVFILLFIFYTNSSLNLIFEDYAKVYEFLEKMVYHKEDLDL